MDKRASAVIMAGGEGARLRPITCGMPKPMVPVLDRPIIEYALCLLGCHGIGSAGITLQYMPDAISGVLGDEFVTPDGRRIELGYFVEREPLGTAGGVKRACRGASGTVIVMSGDGLTDCDLSAALEFHNSRNAMATLVLKRVPVPLEYGVVITDERGRVERFLEKPGWGEVFSDTVNTGIYILEPEALTRIPDGVPYDFGRDLFPALVEAGEAIYGWTMSGYWCDVGDLGAYIRANADVLNGLVHIPGLGLPEAPGILVAESSTVSNGAQVESPCYIGAGAVIESGAMIGAGSVIGHGCRVLGQASIKQSILWPGGEIGSGAQVRGAVIGRGCVLSAGAAAFEQSALGDFSTLGEQAQLMPGAKVWPRKHVAASAHIDQNLVWGSERGCLFGTNGACVSSPQQAALLGQAYAAALGIEELLVMHSSSAEAGILAEAFVSGVCAQGARVMRADTGTLPELTLMQRMLLPQASAFITAASVMLRDSNGLPITRERERKVDGLYQRQDFARPFAHGAIPPEDVSLPRGFYVSQLMAQIRESGDMDAFADAPRTLVFTDDPSLASLAAGLLTKLNVEHRILSREEHHIDLLGKDEVGFVLDSCGEAVRILDKQGMLAEQEQAELLTLVALERGVTQLCLPIGSTRAIEDVVNQRGASIRYTRADPADWMRALNALPAEANGAYQLSLHFDALFAMTQVLRLLAVRQLPLRTLTEDYPTVYRKTTSLSLPLHERGRLLRTLTRMEAAADLTDGLLISEKAAWTWVHPAANQPELMIVTEAYSAAESRRLCAEYARKIRSVIDMEFNP